jgi:hypothetical protein
MLHHLCVALQASAMDDAVWLPAWREFPAAGLPVLHCTSSRHGKQSSINAAFWLHDIQNVHDEDAASRRFVPADILLAVLPPSPVQCGVGSMAVMQWLGVRNMVMAIMKVHVAPALAVPVLLHTAECTLTLH